MAVDQGITVQRGSQFSKLFKCRVDWHGELVDPPVEYGFLLDGKELCFRAQRAKAPICHPASRAGVFQEELWEYEVAEFFLSHPENGSYLEVNLAPNGAWWACLFRAPRERWSADVEVMKGVRAEAEIGKNFWSASLSMPISVLRDLPVGFGEGWGLNATFILEPPEIRYLTATSLGVAPLDFHQPSKFLPLKIRETIES